MGSDNELISHVFFYQSNQDDPRWQPMLDLYSAVRMGCNKWIEGEVKQSKIVSVVEKFNLKYGVNLSDRDKLYRYNNGMAFSALVIYPQLLQEQTGSVRWFLLISGGHLPRAATTERWLDCSGKKDNRFISIDIFELKKIKAHRNSRYVWSWEINKGEFRKIKEKITDFIAKGEKENCESELKNIIVMRSYAGVQQQLKVLKEFVQLELEKNGNGLTLLVDWQDAD